jgi:glutamyl-tRNA reductase
VSELAVFGVNHRTAPLELRERLAIPENDIPALLDKALKSGHVTECVIVSTCNRVEVYAAPAGDGDPRKRLRAAASILLGVEAGELGPAAYLHVERAAVEHLFRVACGLDSLVLGETQILAQLREAFAAAAAAASIGPVFTRLFHQALHVGKRARAESSIASGLTSLASAAVHVLGRHFPRLDGRRGVLLGAGTMARIAAAHLADRELADLAVVNRTLDRAEVLAAGAGARALPLDALADVLADADFLVAACAAPTHLVTAATLRDRCQSARALVAVDLSVPRVIDPAVGGMAAVTVYDLDTLDRMLEAHRSRRVEALGVVEALVAAETDSFLRWCRERAEVSPLLARLTSHCDAVRRQVTERNAKFLGETEPGRADRFAQTLVAKLLDRPLRQIRSWDPDTVEGRHRLEVVRELFGLDEDAAPATEDVFRPLSRST